MPRPKRIDYPGAWHHVWTRGARREAIFRHDEHCQLFLSVLERAVANFGIEVHAYALMVNHYHLLIRSRHGNLPRAMQFINSTYTQEGNRLHVGWDGPIFRGRYKNQLVENTQYLTELLAYIHLNPVRAGLLKKPEEDNGWTSHQAYVGLDVRPSWLSCEVLLELFGGDKNLHGFVLDRHYSRTRWPDGMNLATGWLDVLDERDLVGWDDNSEPAALKPDAEPDVVLKVVCLIAQTPRSQLSFSRRGRNGNMARRLAVYGLTRWTTLTQHSIGQHLGMSTSHVSHTYKRVLDTKTPLLEDWCTALDNHMVTENILNDCD